MTIKILWANLAGGSRSANVAGLLGGYVELTEKCNPDIMLFQEAAREISMCAWAGAAMRNLDSSNSGGPRDLLGQFVTQLREYSFFFAPAIQSNRDSHPDKWKTMKVPEGKIRGQGCAMAVHDRCGIVDFWGEKSVNSPFIEPIELTLPLSNKESIYTGNRDSEPRIVQGLRVKYIEKEFVVWNVHLTTLTGERGEVRSKKDEEAEAIRSAQLELLLQAYRAFQNTDIESNHPEDVGWIIGGDFNASLDELTSALKGEFVCVVDGPTRPSGNQVDNILIDPGHSAEHGMKFKAEILATTSIFQSGVTSRTTLNIECKDIMDGLVSAGVDHLPLLLSVSKQELQQPRESMAEENVQRRPR